MKAKEIAQFLNLSLDSKIKNLSKGNRGRVKIAATLGREAIIIYWMNRSQD